jgi:prohibitin 1
VRTDPGPKAAGGVCGTLFKSVDEFTAKSRDNLTMKDVDIDIDYKTTPAAIPGLYIKYQGDVVQHGQVVKNGTGDLVIAYSRESREAREAIYKAIAQLDANDKGAFTVTAVNVRNLLTDQAIEKKRREVGLAKAEAERLVVEAKGQAEANEIVSRSLTPALKAIKLAELQRDAAIAIAGKAGNTVLLGSSTPLVNVGK